MRNFVLIIGILLSSNASIAHEYYSGFAELEYNNFTQRFEATLSVTGHDFERAISMNDSSFGKLEQLMENETDKVKAINYINDHLSITSGNNTCLFELRGIEVSPNGTVNFYLESTEMELNTSISVYFNLMMETFEEQQNKVTLYYHKQTYTESFLPHEQLKTIELIRE